MQYDIFGSDFSSLIRKIGEVYPALDKVAETAAVELLVESFIVYQIYEALHCRQNPESKVKGEGGAASIMGLHHNTVTYRLRKFGLSVSDLKGAQCFVDLVKKSPYLKERADIVLRCVVERVEDAHCVH